MEIRHIERIDANAYVVAHHRHLVGTSYVSFVSAYMRKLNHSAIPPLPKKSTTFREPFMVRGHRFSLACYDGGRLCGVAIVGRPRSRRIMEIAECMDEQHGRLVMRTLFRYNITDNQIVNNKPKILGYYEKVSNPSENLQKRLRENGMPLRLQQQLFSE